MDGHATHTNPRVNGVPPQSMGIQYLGECRCLAHVVCHHVPGIACLEYTGVPPTYVWCLKYHVTRRLLQRRNIPKQIKEKTKTKCSVQC